MRPSWVCGRCDLPQYQHQQQSDMGNDMNKIYKTVWNTSLACVQVVSELAIGHQSSGGVAGAVQLGLQRFAFFNLALLPMMVWAAVNPDALPQGGNITQGSGQIQQQGNVLNVQQNSQNLHTQWNSFNIGKDATVNFKQPNRSSVAVNQVLDNNASQIMGRLNANGQVFLLNPNGVIFSKTAQVNVGGLVASTLKLSEQDALTGRFKLQGDAKSHARVENHGSIIANGGTVALIAPNVVNTGSIKTPNGVTHLTSANQVTLALQDGSLTQFQVDQGVVQGLVDNQGAIVADNGAVYFTAKGKDALSRAVVNHSGIIEANRLSHNAKGEVILLADMQTGLTKVTGRISAQGMNEQDGGFIETSAAVINIADSADITTLSAQGKTGEWLIDPYNVIISNKSDAGSQNNSNTFNPSQNDSIINVGTLQTALANNNITVTTAGSGTQEGNITVANAVTWSANTDLTLSAHNNIYINANITATHNNAGLNLEYGQANVNKNNKSDYYLANGVKVYLQAGDNFSTKLGKDVSASLYTVINDLGLEGSTTGKDLQGINGGLAKNYVLGKDIDATTTANWETGQGFKPLGDYSAFTGRFDGLGHSITGLTINRTNSAYGYVGLFGNVGPFSGAPVELRNIVLLNSNITGLGSVGSLAGSVRNTNIRNVISRNFNLAANGSSTSSLSVGGLVGYSAATNSFANTLAQGTITATGNGTMNIGGLIGENHGAISQADTNVTITSTNNKDISYVGGLVGFHQDATATIKQSTASGNVTASSTGQVVNAGGLVGTAARNASVTESKAYGNVTATFIASTNTPSYADKSAHAGGLIGTNQTGTVSNSSAHGDVSANAVNGKAYAGGLIGKSGNTSVGLGVAVSDVGKVSNSSATGNVIAASSNTTDSSNVSAVAGGLIGKNEVARVFDSTASGKVEGISSVGGLIGENYRGVIQRSNTLPISTVVGVNAVGGLVGNNFSTLSSTNGQISNSQSQATVIGSGNQVGGLVGVNQDGVLSNIIASGKVTGQSNVGGLVGLNLITESTKANTVATSIVSASATSIVTASGNNVGGLIGNNYNTSSNTYSITNSLALGTVNASNSDNVGGLIGYNKGVNLDNVFAEGTVTGRNNVGGLVGLNQNSNITNANTAATSIVTASGNKVGGLIGNNYSTSSNTYSITNSHALGSVKVNSTSSTSVGGLIAYNQNSNLSDVSASGDVTATGAAAYAGGLVAWNYDGSISNSTATGNVRANSTSIGSIALAGGLMGYNTGAISNSSATGDVSANATITHAGGLVGRNFGGSINIAYASGSVNGNDNVGGLVGSNDNGHIRNAYASGAVTGQNQVGGLVGSHAGTGSIAQTYAIGKVVGTGTDVGGLVGNAASTASVSSSFWDTQSTGVSTSAGGAGANGVSTAQIQDLNTFIKAGWDIDDAGGTGKVWRIYSGQTAPLLRSFLTQKTIAAPTDKTVTYDAAQHSIAPLTGLDGHTLLAGSSTGINAGIYTTSYYSGQQGYDFVGDRESTLTINKAKLTVTANNDRKTYDATAYAGGNGVSYSGFAGNEDKSVLGGSLNYKGSSQGAKNAGSYAIGVDGLTSNNYDFVYQDGALDINKAKLTVTANNHSKTYDATAYAGGNGVSYSGFAGNEDDSVLGGTLNYKGSSQGAKNVGSYVIGVDGYTSNNYDFDYKDGALDITKAKLTVTANNDRKTYDATAYVGGNGVSYSGFAGNEDDSVLGGSLNYKGSSQGAKNAGSYAIGVDGLTSNNYDFVYQDGALTVDKANVTLQAASDSRTYNGTNASNVQVIVNGLQGQDSVSKLSQSFDSRNAGNRTLSVDASYVVNDGNNGGNYDVTVSAPAQGNIAKATLDLQAATDSRTYNGTAVSNGKVTASGLFGTDQVTGLSQSFDSRNAGTRDLLVNNGYVVDDGNGGLNYDVVTHTASGSIAKAKLDAVTGVGALDRVYNGLLGVDLDYSQARIVGTLFGADQVSVAHTGTGTMANKRAGVNKQVNIQGLGLSGADAGNYELSDNTAQTQVDISKASIGSVSGLKGIDRQVNASNSVAIDVSGAQLSQVVAGDQVFVSSAQGSVANNQAGTHLVSITDIDLGGTDADNYEWDFAPTTTTVNIVPVSTVAPTVPPTVAPTVAPRPTPTVAFSSANPYQRAIDFDEDRLKNPLNGNPVQIEIIGNGVNTDGIQTLSGGLR